MQKSEAEKAVRALCHVWRKESGNERTPANELSSGDFLSWLSENHSAYLNFRSVAGAAYDIDLWFDQEFKQAWSR